MFEDDYNEEEESGLTLSERMALEDIIVKVAFNNSFNVITKRKTFEEIVNGKNEDSSSAIMAHDPEEGMSTESLENMITYFLQTEEYEKCAEIRDIIKVQDECIEES